MHTEDFYCALMFEQMQPCDPSAPLREVHISLNSDLLRIAEDLGMDLSAACERALTEQVRRVLYERWRRCPAESPNGTDSKGFAITSDET